MSHAIAAPLRRTLVRIIKELPEHEVDLFLSGGVDSWSLMFAALEAGKTVRALTFAASGAASEDLTLAAAASKEFLVPWVPITLDLSPDRIIQDVAFMKQTLGLKTKAELECVLPFLQSIPFVEAPAVLMGHGADDMYGTTKKAAIHFKDRLDDFRREELLKSQNQVDGIMKLFKQRVIMPYEHKDVQDLFQGWNWKALNSPKLKQPTRDAFEAEIAAVNRTPLRRGLQSGKGGIAEIIARNLLDSPYNVMRALNPVAIYNIV